jgi:hypothetical protein
MCCNPEDSWEELEPSLVMSATVVNLRDVSINQCSGQSARYDGSKMGSDCSPDPLCYELSTPTHAGRDDYSRRRSGLSQPRIGGVGRDDSERTEVMRFSDQAESSVSDPAAHRHPDVVRRVALSAAEPRRRRGYRLTHRQDRRGRGARSGAAGGCEPAAPVARTFIRAASPDR